MILSPVISQPYGSNVRENLLKRSRHTDLKHSNPYTFILQKFKNPPDIFFTHIFFASETMLIFGGLFLHSISRILKVNLKWLRAPITEF